MPQICFQSSSFLWIAAAFVVVCVAVGSNLGGEPGVGHDRDAALEKDDQPANRVGYVEGYFSISKAPQKQAARLTDSIRQCVG